MHILMNAISAKTGGIATYTRNLIRSLSARGVRADIHVSKHLGKSVSGNNDICVHSEGASNFGTVRRLIWEQTVWRRKVKGSGSDVLFSSANYALLKSPKPQLLLLREGGLFNPVYLRHVMGRMGLRYRVESIIRRFLMNISAGRADRLMFPTESMRDWMVRGRPDLAKKSVVNWYGTNINVFDLRSRRGWRDDGTIRLLYVSVYYPHKDPSTLAEAVRCLNKQGVRSHARITMERDQFQLWRTGRREWESLQEMYKTENLSFGAVRYEDLPDLYASHDVSVFPSVSETFGHSLVESMAAGIPIIAADTLTNREVCGPAALYFPRYDHEALADRIRALDEDPALRAWLGEQGHRRAREHFQWEDHVSRLEETLTELAGQENT